MSKTLNEWAAEIHQNAVDHGWWDEERSFGDIVALCHSELSEALEAYRNKEENLWYACTLEGVDPTDECYDLEENCPFRDGSPCRKIKPEGVAVEMIDCMIRILDWCGREGVDVDALLQAKHKYNKTRPYRHGGKTL